MEVTEAAQPQLSPTPSKKVSFAAAPHEEGASPSPPRKASPDGKAGSGASAAPGAACPQLHSNALFSPERQGSWTIEAQRSDRMEGPPAGGEAAAAPSPSPSPLPSIGLASGGGAYTPASSSWLESARKVNDLQDRLAGLEAALKEMESKVGGAGERSRGEGQAQAPSRGRGGGWPLMRRAGGARRMGTKGVRRAARPAAATGGFPFACCLVPGMAAGAPPSPLLTPRARWAAGAGCGAPGPQPAGESAGHGGQDCAKAVHGRQGAGSKVAAPDTAGMRGLGRGEARGGPFKPGAVAAGWLPDEKPPCCACFSKCRGANA